MLKIIFGKCNSIMSNDINKGIALPIEYNVFSNFILVVNALKTK